MIHLPGCSCEAYACQLRAKGVQLSAGRATTIRKGKPGSNAEHNGWERGVAGERRKGGTFMPYLDAKGDVIPIREGVAKRAHHREIRQRHHDEAVAAGHHH
jgi:hypothetical protein